MSKSNGRWCTLTCIGVSFIYSVCPMPKLDLAQLPLLEPSSYKLYVKSQQCTLYTYKCWRHPHIFCMPKAEGVCFTLISVGGISYILHAEDQRFMLHTYTCWRHPHIFRIINANGWCCTITGCGCKLIYTLCLGPTLYVAHLHVVEISSCILYNQCQRWMFSN